MCLGKARQIQSSSSATQIGCYGRDIPGKGIQAFLKKGEIAVN